MFRFGGERVYPKEDARGEIISRNKPAIIRKVKKSVSNQGSTENQVKNFRPNDGVSLNSLQYTSKTHSLAFR